MLPFSPPFQAARIAEAEIRALIASINDTLSYSSADPRRSTRDDDLTMPGIMTMLDYPEVEIEALRIDVNSYLEGAAASMAAINVSDGEGFFEDDSDRSPEIQRMHIMSAITDIEGAKAGMRRLKNRINVRVKGFYKLTGAAQAAAAKGIAWIGTIMSWLKNISSLLWSMLAKLTTPVEWKLSGKVGTGALGLLDVGVEITFTDGNPRAKTT